MTTSHSPSRSSLSSENSPWRRFPSMLLRASRYGRASRILIDSEDCEELNVSTSGVGRSISCFVMSAHNAAQIRRYVLTPLEQLRRDIGHQSVPCSRAAACRRSLNASTSPILAQRCRSPGRSLLQSSSASTSNTKALPIGVPLRSYSTRSGSSLMPAQHSVDNRRWSVASLPSSSGYGTPGSNSAFSSEYSSQEQLCDLLNDMRMAPRFDSNDSYPFMDDMQSRGRPRSRSLTSPVKFGSDSACNVIVRSTVYKERFPKAKQQMEERLVRFIEENAPLSGVSTSSVEAASSSTPIPPPVNSAEGPLNMSPSSPFSRRSVIVSASNQPGVDSALLRLIADGATRFIHHQIVEIASDCLAKSREDVITCAYFCEMSQRLEETLTEAHDKTSSDSFAYLTKLVRSLLMIVSRPARLLECLEFNPDEFYHLLEEAEGAVREQLGSGNARVPDLPQYIISKLGLDRDPLSESQDAELNELDHSPVMGFSFEGHLPPGDNRHKWPPETRLPCEDDYETIRLISNGAYGAVYLVRHRETRQRFALKRMNKQTLMMRNQVDQVYAERDILTFTDNPFVVSFYGSFETRHHLCMLMEYVEGGDCAALLKNVGTLPIDLARLYIAETILAIDYLHSCGIVHRDLKPDNLLITAMGHIKLTDFGLSKIGLMNRTTLVSEGYLDVADTQQFKDKQLCGTPEYIAPEVILRQGYGKPVDWWALGVIIYEFLIGIVPFVGETPEQLFANIISEEEEFPEGDEALPPEAESLISQLLEKNPAERLGTVGGAQQLMIQPFFGGLDFRSLLRQKAEFVPQLSSEEDTSYFDARTDRYNLMIQPFFGGLDFRSLLRQKAEFVPQLSSEEDTSYFDARTDRYNHDAESGDDESTPMFGSFSTASPRHSIVGLDPSTIPTSPLAIGLTASSAALNNNSALQRGRADSESLALQHSSDSFEGHTFDPSSECPIPTAVFLRRRFSAQRQANLSTSSSGTTGTGCLNTACSSTDSSMDAGAFAGDLPRKSPQPVDSSRRTASTPSPLPRFAISCEPTESATHMSDKKELSPVEESRPICETNAVPETGNEEGNAGTTRVALRGGGTAHLTSSGTLQLVIPGSSSAHSHTQQSPAGSVSSVSSQDGSSPNPSFTLPVSAPDTSVSSHVSSLKPPIIIKRGPKGFGFTIHSMRVYLGEHSDFYTIEHVVSDVDESSPAYEAGLRPNDLITHVNSMAVSNLTHPQLMNRLLAYGNELSIKVTPLSATSIREGAARRSVGKLARKKPKRPQRRVPLEKKPRKPSSLLRRLSGKRTTNDIVPGSSSQKQTFMPRSVSSQDGIQLSNPSGVNIERRPFIDYMRERSVYGVVTPLSATSIREGAARRSVGKLARKKPKRPQRRVPLEKKPRKPSSLLRRLSGKRTTNDIVPGSSSQKQTFMPRSVSSQDGIQLSNPSGVAPSVLSTSSAAGPSQVKVLAETGLSGEETCTVVGSTSPLVMPQSASRPSTFQGLKHKVAGMAHHLTARKQSSTQMPVSPLARHENISVSPTRSPSPSPHSKKHLLGSRPTK
ncbi:Microtubule-associated serine/threonine-protein kinase 2 [Toxocara canis]|uniref:non-specific serine/threonine protein kinase n=1 Tax=Toxocara canis TaxID=6265 RepID=A0A0B2V5Z6_TOXCA|nr:Microtubule-associated serine/threonine-protein kinase 2 [Toxocara canis]